MRVIAPRRYCTTIELPDGRVQFAPSHPECRKGFTTFQQWWCNMMWTVVLLERYPGAVHSLAQHFGLAVLPASSLWHVFLRVGLFPLNVWMLEIVEGYMLMFLYGFNPAWTYTSPDAYFHGNICLSHASVWWLLGVLVEVVYHPWLAPTIKAWVGSE